MRKSLERQASKKFYNKNSRSQIVFRTDIFRKLTLGATEKGKGAHEPEVQTAGAVSLAEACLGVLLIPPGRDASPSQGYPPAI